MSARPPWWIAAPGLALGALAVLGGTSLNAGAAGPDRFPAALASRIAPVRQALIVAPGGAPSDGQNAYRDLLVLLGFDVTVTTSDSRPDLELDVRGFASGVKRDADVAVLIFGAIVTDGHDLFVLPRREPMPPSDMMASEGIRLADAMRRVAGRTSKDVVLIADGCTGAGEDRACTAGLAAMPAGVSAILAERTPPAASATPPNLDLALLPLMTEEGQSLSDLFTALSGRLSHEDLRVAGTATLSKTFAFLPRGFLEGLPLDCNGVNPLIDADALRARPSLEPLLAQCRSAAARYDFSPVFKVKLAVVAEQRAAQKALADCSGDLAAAYLQAYPTGRYKDAVAARQRACAPPKPERSPAPDNPVQARALAAVTDYFRRHDYQQGDAFGNLARLYPPQFRRREGLVSRTDHLRGLGAWYGDYDSVRFDIDADGLDYSGCTQDDSCVVRGTVKSRTLRSGEDQYAFQDQHFTLRLNLTTSQVLAECGVTEAPTARDAACE